MDHPIEGLQHMLIAQLIKLKVVWGLVHCVCNVIFDFIGTITDGFSISRGKDLCLSYSMTGIIFKSTLLNGFDASVPYPAAIRDALVVRLFGLVELAHHPEDYDRIFPVMFLMCLGLMSHSLIFLINCGKFMAVASPTRFKTYGS